MDSFATAISILSLLCSQWITIVPNLESAFHFSGDLHRLTKTIGAAIAFFGVLLLAIIAYAGWSANETATERERTLLENALNQSIARALNEQKSVAWWDDAVLKITDEAIDLDFVDANFGIFLTETYGHDEVYILNGEDHRSIHFSKPKDTILQRSSVGVRLLRRLFSRRGAATIRTSKPARTISVSRKATTGFSPAP